MKNTFLAILFLCCSTFVFGQNNTEKGGFSLSIEPNLLLGNRTFSNLQNKGIYVKNSNSVGVSIGFGYTKDFGSKLSVATDVHFLLLRNAVKLDFQGSGLNDSSQIKYSGDSYGFEYVTALGLGIDVGYKVIKFRRSAISIGLGIRFDVTPVKTDGNTVQVNLNSGSSVGTFADAYQEEITKQSNFNINGDIFAQYNFHLGKVRMLTAFHYRPAFTSSIKGNFESFEGFSGANSGSFELKRNYAGIAIGIFLGKKSK